MSSILVMLMAIEVVVIFCCRWTCLDFSSCPFRGASTPPFISRGARLQGR
jgi:hypothetical protein